MNDKEIRKILISWLQACNSEIRIYQEKSIGTSICDLMAVTDCLTGYEIKSDLDNYQRLDRQIKNYDKIFDKNYIVVGQQHSTTIEKRLPFYWGIIVVMNDHVHVARKAQHGKPSLKNKLKLLWKIELKNILCRLNLPPCTYKSKDYIIQYLLSENQENQINNALLYELMHRDYSIFNARDYTFYSNTIETRTSDICDSVPAEEFIDSLSEQDLQQITLDQWINLYTKAKKLQQTKEKYQHPTKKAGLLPHKISYKDIEVSPGTPWISWKIIDDFIYYLIWGKERWQYPTHKQEAKLYYEDVTGYWFISNKKFYHNSRLDYDFGAPNYNALYILEAILNLREIRRETREETVAALDKQQKIINLFKEWIWQDEDRRWKVEENYNQLFHNFHPRHYDGRKLIFPQMSDSISLYPYQKNAVQRIIHEKNTLLAYDVGAGKTYIMIAAAMKLRQEGISRKNLFVVPNNIVGQWEQMFFTLFPSSKILTVAPKSFKPELRQKILRQIQCGDFDGIIMAYSCFELIPLSQECLLKQMDSDLKQIQDVIKTIRSEPGIGAALNREENYIRKLTGQLSSLFHTATDEITFDKLEINTIFVDEAHNFKNIPIRSNLKNIAGVNLKGSLKCLHMQHVIRCIQEQNNGRGAVLATGTPLSNSISDAYAMQMYLQPDIMKETHLDRFDNWIKSFAKPEYVCEIDVDTSKYRYVHRLAKFFNLPELSQMFASVTSFYSVQEETGLPEIRNHHNIILKESPELSKYMENLCNRTELIRARIIDRSKDNMLKVSTDGRKAALDLRLVNRTQPQDETCKIRRCEENVLYLYRKYPHCSQIIFCDYSTPKKDRFNVYSELKEHLVEQGIPQEDIAFIHSYQAEASRLSLYEKVNTGNIRILIGSTFKLGIGANVQTLLKAIHHLDVPWRPADVVQREGRIIRKGNHNNEIHIFRYITEGSFDSYSWQLLETKQRFISQFLSGSAYQRSTSDLEDNVLTYAQVKALAISEPLMKELAEKQNELHRLRILSSSFNSNLSASVKSAENKKKQLSVLKQRLECTIANADHLKKFGKEDYKHSADSIKSSLDKNTILGEIPFPEDLEVMEFKITLPERQNVKKPYIILNRLNTPYSVNVSMSSSGNVRRLYNFFIHFSRQIEETQKQLDTLESSLKELDEIKVRKNPYPDQIQLLQNEVDELQKQIPKKKSSWHT